VSPDRDSQPLDAAGAPLAPAVASREEDLLNAWDRLLAIAALYPAQNTRFHEAAARWRAALRPVARADGSLCVEIGREERLAHEGVVQAPERVARCRLYPLLTGIGVEHMLLSLDIDAEALHQLLAILRETRQTADRAIGFQHAELPALPAGVTVKLRSFGSPGETLLGGAPLGSGEAGAASTQRSSGADIADVYNPHIGVQSDLARSLEDKLTAQATTLYHSLTDGILPEALPAPAGDGKSGHPPRKDGTPRAEAAPPFDALQLCDRLARMEADAPFDTHLLGPSQPEWFAFLVQLAIAEDDGAATLRARAQLAQAMERDLGLQEIQILVAACEGLLATGDSQRVDALLPLLLDPLADRAQGLEAVLAALVQGADAGRRELLWPHLADAFLRERITPGLAQTTGADGEPALALPAELRPFVLARLEARPALQTGRLSSAIFRPLRAEMRPLLLVLLHSSRGSATGDQLRAALLESPPPAPFAGLLALLGDYKPSQREFFRLLLGADDAAETAALGREAAALALQVLQRLPRGERRRPDVGDALLALAAAPPGEADALLAAVLGERRLLLLPAWPAAARRLARRLQQDRQRGRRRAGTREERTS
jgi:hypothetical protein